MDSTSKEEEEENKSQQAVIRYVQNQAGNWIQLPPQQTTNTGIQIFDCATGSLLERQPDGTTLFMMTSLSTTKTPLSCPVAQKTTREEK